MSRNVRALEQWRGAAGLALWGALLAVLALAVPVMLPAALPAAAAHDSLVSSDPEADASLEQAPEQITLSYSAEVLDLSTVVQVTDADDAEVGVGEPEIDGTDVTVDLPELPAGDYEVQWRVVSSDGHPIEGTFPFTVTEGTQPTADDPAPGVAPEDSDKAATAEATAGDAAATEGSAETTGEDVSEGIPTTGIVLGIIVLLLVVGIIVLVVTRQRGGDSVP